MTILDAMRDPQLFGPWFADRASWRPWETFLAALFGLPSDEDSAAALFSQHTGRTVPPTQPAHEANFRVLGSGPRGSAPAGDLRVRPYPLVPSCAVLSGVVLSGMLVRRYPNQILPTCRTHVRSGSAAEGPARRAAWS